MSDESERLRRLREKQLQTRDPQKKQRKISGRVSNQYKSRAKYSTSTAMADMPHKWKGLFGGFVLGVLIWVGLIAFVKADWVDTVGLLAAVLLPMLGFLFGASFDWRDGLRDV